MKNIRPPAVAGYFYESDPSALKKQIEKCFLHKIGVGKIPPKVDKKAASSLLLISPHAGYMYSGPVASHGYYKLAEAGLVDTVIIIGPNHHGVGSALAVSNEDAWKTPLGEVELDKEAIKEIVASASLLEVDNLAHMYEHSIEVQIPFLQYIYPEGSFKIVPIAMRFQAPEAAEDIANGIKTLIEKNEDRVYAIIASSDFSHYEPYEKALVKDMKAINLIKELRINDFYNYVIENDVSICGIGPIMTVMILADFLKKYNITLLKYATSGDITGDKSAVVGYASIIFE